MALIVLLVVPLFAAVFLAFVGDRKFAPEINILGSAATFVAGVVLAVDVYLSGPMLAGGKFFFVDAFNVYLSVLTSFVSMTTAIFSRRYMRREREHGRVGHVGMRFYHAMFQLFIFAMLLCLLTNNIGVLWIAMELATLSTVLLVSLYRTPTAIEAAWKYFILCGVGIAQALFGTVLLYFAAEKVLGEGGEALLWTNQPAMLMAIFTISLASKSTSLSQMIQVIYSGQPVLKPSIAFALLAFILIALTETGRIPVDNPATHLELTMIHEAMILEYSGRHLALIEWAGMMKLFLFSVLGIAVFAPWGIAPSGNLAAIPSAMLFVTLKLGFIGVVLVAIETVLAKMRLFRLTEFLGSAFLLATLGMLSYFILD